MLKQSYFPTIPPCVLESGASVAREVLSTGVCQAGVEENCSTEALQEGMTQNRTSGLAWENVIFIYLYVIIFIRCNISDTAYWVVTNEQKQK